MNNKLLGTFLFLLGFTFGLSFSLTVRPVPERDLSCENAMATLQMSLDKLPPTRTPHVCPPVVECEVCPYYKALPNVTGVLSTLGLVDYEMSLVDTKLENFIGAQEGEYNWTLVHILSLHRSAHVYLLEAGEEITYWFNLGYLTCEGSE